MQNDQLLVLANQLVDIKVPFVDAEYKKQLALEVRDKIEETVQLELLSAMTPEQAAAFGEMLERDDLTDQEIIEYVEKCEININVINSTALTKFRVAYLGA